MNPMKFDIQPLIERFNGLDIRARYAVFAACVLAAAGLDYAFIIRAQMHGLEKTDRDIQTVSTDLEHVKADIQRVRQIKQGLETSRSQLQTLNDKIHPVQEVPLILEDISRTANEFHVNIDQLTPLKEAQEALVTAADAKYYALPIVIGARSGYHMFGHFLNKLESGNLLFIMKDLHMEGGGGKDGNNLTVQAVLKVILVDRTPEVKK